MIKLLTLAMLLAAAVALMALAACDGGRSTAEPTGPPTAGPTGGPTQPQTSQTGGPTQPPTVGATPTPPPGTIRPISPTPRPTPQVDVVPGLEADSFIAVVPKRLRAGYAERVSVSLFNGDSPVAGDVVLTLFDGRDPVASVEARVNGAANLELPIPQLEPGLYLIEIEVEGVPEIRSSSILVEEGFLLFVETDKPIYKPGQTVRIRLMTLDALLKPWPSTATVEVQDAKGIKVFKREVATDDYGMTTLDLPLSTEPNLGVWKLTALAGEQKTQLDVRVEEYVLPKYEVVVDTDKDWVLTNEAIQGVVSGEYSFGKPVVGDYEIVAWRYVGQWEKYARASGSIDGGARFTIRQVGYVAGVPAAGGQGNVRLDVTIREKGTGYEEATSRLLTVAAAPVVLKVIPENSVFKPGLDMSYLVIAEEPDGTPVDTDVTVTIEYLDSEFDSFRQGTANVATSGGKALVKFAPPSDAVRLVLHASTAEAYASLVLQSGHSPSGNFIHLEQVTEGGVGVGDTVRFRVHSTREARNFYYEVLSRGTVIFTDVSSSPDIEFTATQLMAPSSRILVYQILPNNEIAADYLPFSVEGSYPHEVQVSFGSDGVRSEEVRPGDSVDISLQTQGEARVGLVAVDKSVFILAENRLNLQQVFNELERLYLEPQVELHDVDFYDDITTRGAWETFEDAGAIILTNKNVPTGESHEYPWEVMEAEAMADDGMPPMEAAAPAPTAEPSVTADAPGGLAEVQRVRQFFPETWIWQDVYTNADGAAVAPVVAPDSITTWILRAVGLSKEHGLGIGESQLRVFQPFFLTVDLPFSAIRGEELPVKVALFNYLDTQQEMLVEIEEADWFDLLDQTSKSVSIRANDIGGVEFKIRPTGLGRGPVKITARSTEAADAVIKELLVEPEGVAVETVDNQVVSDGHQQRIPLRSAPQCNCRVRQGLRGPHRELPDPEHRGPGPTAEDALRVRRAEHDPVCPQRVRCPLPERNATVEAGDNGQGRAPDDRGLPAGADLPQAGRQLLGLRRLGPARQPVAHGLRRQDLRRGEGADVRGPGGNRVRHGLDGESPAR